jgi:hypothetical protein
VKKFNAFILILIIVFPLSNAFSGEVTELSKKASLLELGMTRKAVIKFLGHSTWAILPSDKGEWSLPDPRIKLELYWQNRPCSPVVVSFNNEYRVTGWDEGRGFCGEDVSVVEPTDEYLCDKSDRKNICK